MSSPTTSEDGPISDVLSPDTVVRLDRVSVRYRMPRERVTSIKDYAIRRLKGRIHFDEFWALRDVSLEVVRGSHRKLASEGVFDPALYDRIESLLEQYRAGE